MSVLLKLEQLPGLLPQPATNQVFVWYNATDGGLYAKRGDGSESLLMEGPIGPQGPQGDTGAGGTSFDFTQSVPDTLWTINHNLGYWPSITVYDNSATQLIATITNVSINQITVNFTYPMSGYARLT